MSFKIVEKTLSADLAASGTTTFGYPTGTDEDSFAGFGHKAVAIGNVLTSPGDFTLTFGSASVTFTYGSGKTTIPAGAKVSLQLNLAGVDSFKDEGKVVNLPGVSRLSLVRVDLGSPIVADTDNMVKAATGAELPNAETVTYTPDTDATTPTDGVGPVVTKSGVDYWELDVPRNISVLTTHGLSIVAMTVTVTGLDQYGVAMSEVITVAATGTSATDAGLKAFKWIRSVAFTAATNAEANTSNVGFGDLLGVPFYLGTVDAPVIELEDNATVTAGTTVKGVDTAATTTTGDVRGTYDPNSAADGAKNFVLYVASSDPTYKGVAQA